jgi:hypothetical protein
MRQMSAERRKIVMLGGTMAALGLMLRPMLHGHPWGTWLFLGLQVVVIGKMLALLWRVRKNDCV